MIQYDAHQLANLFRLMKGDEFAALVTSVRQHGFDPAHPIVLYEGKVLDGRNRYRAAQEAGVEATFIEWTGDDPWTFVWRENAVRRHLDPGQRAALFIKVIAGSTAYRAERSEAERRANEARAEATRAQPREGNRLAPSGAVPRDTAPERPKRDERERNAIAAEAKVSSTTAGRALALKKKSPDLFDKVAGGEVSLTRALEQAGGGKKKTPDRYQPPPPPTTRFDPKRGPGACPHCAEEHTEWRYEGEPTFDGGVLHKWLCLKCSRLTRDDALAPKQEPETLDDEQAHDSDDKAPAGAQVAADAIHRTTETASIEEKLAWEGQGDARPSGTRRDIRQYADPGVGDDTAPIGTVGWAQRVRLTMVSLVEDLPKAPQSFSEYERVVREQSAWTLMNKPDGSFFSSFEEFCAHRKPWGLGHPYETIRPLLGSTFDKANTLAPVFALVRQIHPDDVPDAVAALQAIVRTRGAA